MESPSNSQVTHFIHLYLETFDPARAYSEAFALPLSECKSLGASLLKNHYILSRIDAELRMMRRLEDPDFSSVCYANHIEMLAILRDEARINGKEQVAFQCELARGKAGGVYDMNRADTSMSALQEIHDTISSRRSRHVNRSEEFLALEAAGVTHDQDIIVGPSEAALYMSEVVSSND